MDFSKLTQNEKLAVYAAVAAVIGGLGAVFSYSTYSGAWIGILAGLGMLAIVLLPQTSPNTRLPGSKGTLMLVAGVVAAVVLLLLFLINIGFIFTQFGLPDILFLLAVAGSVVMGWAGWQEFQAEGGRFQLGTPASGAVSAPPATRVEPATAAARPAVAAAPTQPVESTAAAPPADTAAAAPSADAPKAAPSTDPDQRPPA
jgi:hypothetical protein